MRKVEPQVPKVVTKSEVGDRDDVNTEYKWGLDDICEEILGRSGASDGDVGF